MKFYLSSYKIGNLTNKLQELVANKVIGYIPNALDFVEREARQESNNRDIKDLINLGIKIELLDLVDYFGKTRELKNKINTLGGVWVRGGNTFVLRQAMKLSGFDEIIKSLSGPDFLYAGYSAGVCVLAPSLKALQNVDEPNVMPYSECRETVWEGLSLLDYIILPHYKSDHPESLDIDKEVEYCQNNHILFKTLKDGEVIVIE